MIKGLTMIAAMVVLALLVSASAQSEVYKVVDDKGNVTYTDQVPADGSAPIKLPELSIIETNYPPETSGDNVVIDAETPSDPTPRELRRMYQDFRITRPVQEETIWGIDNPVVVSWGSSAALQPNMTVRLFVNGQPRENTQDSMAALKLERGEHQVYAELLDARGRRVVASPPVTFFVRQNTVGSNQPTPTPHGGT